MSEQESGYRPIAGKETEPRRDAFKEIVQRSYLFQGRFDDYAFQTNFGNPLPIEEWVRIYNTLGREIFGLQTPVMGIDKIDESDRGRALTHNDFTKYLADQEEALVGDARIDAIKMAIRRDVQKRADASLRAGGIIGTKPRDPYDAPEIAHRPYLPEGTRVRLVEEHQEHAAGTFGVLTKDSHSTDQYPIIFDGDSPNDPELPYIVNALTINIMMTRPMPRRIAGDDTTTIKRPKETEKITVRKLKDMSPTEVKGLPAGTVVCLLEAAGAVKAGAYGRLEPRKPIGFLAGLKTPAPVSKVRMFVDDRVLDIPREKLEMIGY